MVGQKLIARDRYQPSGNDSDGGPARVDSESGVGGPEPGVVGADQPDSAVAGQAGESHHAGAATASTATGVAAVVDAVVAVVAAAVAMVAAAVIDDGEPDTRAPCRPCRCMAIRPMAPGPHVRPTSATGMTP